jgi:hypothetical protein
MRTKGRFPDWGIRVSLAVATERQCAEEGAAVSSHLASRLWKEPVARPAKRRIGFSTST